MKAFLYHLIDTRADNSKYNCIFEELFRILSIWGDKYESKRKMYRSMLQDLKEKFDKNIDVYDFYVNILVLLEANIMSEPIEFEEFDESFDYI